MGTWCLRIFTVIQRHEARSCGLLWLPHAHSLKRSRVLPILRNCIRSVLFVCGLITAFSLPSGLCASGPWQGDLKNPACAAREQLDARGMPITPRQCACTGIFLMQLAQVPSSGDTEESGLEFGIPGSTRLCQVAASSEPPTRNPKIL